ncbi:response regulator RpfG family c-di-GMP phosphodiesterase [Chitinivorax tropicus]|uniref:Response regulator RpfG family c-di-GMP phosphodiesterase n=1 Tax=Chitinivorax tropicus TaxID=714531 RepID=A0A840MLF9_9PROT|nr:DUF3369 domain-containing protein [Chitinivorax tropicus]MBB5017552.1 response regulator RpfG family c-di-GMP phosphodiesterase [Chitinivorax tropicus]
MSGGDNADDSWIIDDDAGAEPSNPLENKPWRVLIVDDEADVHSVTKLALRNVTFKGRPLELLSAYTGREAAAVLRADREIALVLLDVVMESDDAGLKLVELIRGDINNQLVRIVLRTGQPGQAPEQRVIVDYDINDYKAKTELTTQKLFTTVIASLRAYEGLVTIERSRAGLSKILEGATNLYQVHSLRELASGVLNQISAILDVGADGMLCVVQNRQGAGMMPQVIAATGNYTAMSDDHQIMDEQPAAKAVARALAEGRSVFDHPLDVLYTKTMQGHEFAILVTPPWPLADIQRDLLEVFCNRIAAAFDNLYLYDQLRKAQEATVSALADLAEFRDKDTGGHVQRVRLLTDAITRILYQQGKFSNDLTPEFLEMVGIASILHDVGKVGTPDRVLLKPARHTPEERAIMEEHAEIGEVVLARASEMVDGTSYLTFGAQIAGYHHEHVDGSGYPRGLKRDEIPLAARIVAVVDVFDALLHRRPYKEPWPLVEVMQYISERSGKQFDPDVVDALAFCVKDGLPAWLQDGE